MMAGELGGSRRDSGVEWKSIRRSTPLSGSTPVSLRHAADAAVGKLGWRKPYYLRRGSTLISPDGPTGLSRRAIFILSTSRIGSGSHGGSDRICRKETSGAGGRFARFQGSTTYAALRQPEPLTDASGRKVSCGGQGSEPDLSPDRHRMRKAPEVRDRSFDG